MFKGLKKNNDKLVPIFIKGIVLGVLVNILLLLIFAAVILLADIDRAFAQPLSSIALGVGGFVAAIYTAKKIGGKGYLVGLIIGLLSFVVVTLIGLIINKNGLTKASVFRFIISFLSSVIGGIIGVNKKTQKYI
ncbi:MAG: TIGR04086 family membrane protein [Acutalibacteraceae bacterium]|jgi:putative membrane protein (TIGR04086 family)|nr:TIGR04086 family membrane protein [Acutalibacteraceae bacterium]